MDAVERKTPEIVRPLTVLRRCELIGSLRSTATTRDKPFRYWDSKGLTKPYRCKTRLMAQDISHHFPWFNRPEISSLPRSGSSARSIAMCSSLTSHTPWQLIISHPLGKYLLLAGAPRAEWGSFYKYAEPRTDRGTGFHWRLHANAARYAFTPTFETCNLRARRRIFNS